jgi:type II secretion system protein G
LEGVLELYKMDNGAYPTTAQTLSALVVKPSIEPLPSRYPAGGYLKDGHLPIDPWGNPYRYAAPGFNNPDSYDLWSLGPDGLAGGSCSDANVGNWPPPTPSLFECPDQHPLVQAGVQGLLATAVLATSALLILVAVRAFRALRDRGSWRSVISVPPLSFALVFAGLYLLFWVLLFAIVF